jgi:hypothetical protein
LLNFFDDHIAQHGLAIMIPRPYATWHFSVGISCRKSLQQYPTKPGQP